MYFSVINELEPALNASQSFRLGQDSYIPQPWSTPPFLAHALHHASPSSDRHGQHRQLGATSPISKGPDDVSAPTSKGPVDVSTDASAPASEDLAKTSAPAFKSLANVSAPASKGLTSLHAHPGGGNAASH
ncbi:hypothetical protein ILYODFUR_038378 [Ilyodon furcidens]|uniref:Uncharacterized protein n=1 Tax=Ilyodon furcidens TaxID=33524 RepID=A0ABV0TEU8_9TELE